MSTPEIEESISQFLQFFEEKIEIVKTSEFRDSNSLFKKTLYVGFIDALSKTTAHKKKGNRDRLISFLLYFCEWKELNKISLPHLVRLLEKVPDPEFRNVREHAYEEFDKWGSGQILDLSHDPDYEVINKLWPKEIPKPLENIQLSFLKHSNLFYKYRNSLVHELREPGYGMEFKEDKRPFYHAMENIDTGLETWELVYPLGFYEEIISTAIINLRTYYRKERIDPYKLYNFGTYWIDELNG
jgi:hypothetical protein